MSYLPEWTKGLNLPVQQRAQEEGEYIKASILVAMQFKRPLIWCELDPALWPELENYLYGQRVKLEKTTGQLYKYSFIEPREVRDFMGDQEK